MTVTAAEQQAPPQPKPSRRRGVTPLTPMRQAAAKSMTKLADGMKDSHPDLSVHQHVRDAARTLREGNEEAAQRHLRAAMFALTPQSLMRNGIHTDDPHIAARDAMHRVHRHLLLVKDIADVAAKNQRAIDRDSYGDLESSPSLPNSPERADPNAGYGPGALAQKPTARQPGGDKALNAPNRTNSGGADPAAADPQGPQPKGSKQFATWDEAGHAVEAAIELADATWDWADLDGVIALASSGGRHTPGTSYDWRHGYIPLTTAAATSHGHGKVPKGWHAPSGGSEKPSGPKYAHPETRAHDTATRQAVRDEDFDAAENHLKQMDKLEGKAGVGADEGMRPAIRKTAGHMKLLRQGRQADYRALPKEREKQAQAIDRTASEVITSGGFGRAADVPERAARVKASLTSAASALRAGDHQAASRHLADAQHVAEGDPGSRILTSGRDGRAASVRTAEQSSQVQRLAQESRSLAKYAPKPKIVKAANTWDDLSSVIELSARTAQLEVTPAPYGKPGGPGLYGVKGMKHSDYFENIVKALREKRGMSKARASKIAYGALRKWSRGGGGVHPEVRAAATGALAEEKAKGAAAKAAHGHAVTWDDVGGVVELAVSGATVRGWDGAAARGWDEVSVELATVIDLFNPAGNPGQARTPQGKFTQGGSQQQKGGKQAKGKPQPKGKQAAHAKHVAHVQHQARQARQKAGLLKQARQDRVKAAGIMKQITALQKVIAAAQAGTGKTVSSSSNVTKATTGSTTAASASTKAAAASTASAASGAASTASTTASTTAKATAAGKQLGPLQAQYKSLMASAAKATAQAAKL